MRQSFASDLMRKIKIVIKISIKEAVKAEGGTEEMEVATAEEGWALGLTADVTIAAVGNFSRENKQCH